MHSLQKVHISGYAFSCTQAVRHVVCKSKQKQCSNVAQAFYLRWVHQLCIFSAIHSPRIMEYLGFHVDGIMIRIPMNEILRKLNTISTCPALRLPKTHGWERSRLPRRRNSRAIFKARFPHGVLHLQSVSKAGFCPSSYPQDNFFYVSWFAKTKSCSQSASTGAHTSHTGKIPVSLSDPWEPACPRSAHHLPLSAEVPGEFLNFTEDLTSVS